MRVQEAGESSPDSVDDFVLEYKNENIGVVVAIEERTDADSSALEKYAHLALLMTGKHSYQALIDLLEDWTEQLNLPRLKSFGLQDSDLAKIVEHSRGSSMKTNPIVLTDSEIRLILENRM